MRLEKQVKFLSLEGLKCYIQHTVKSRFDFI